MTLFSDLGLQPEILRAIEEMGFTTPTPIQEQTIPLLIQGPQDLVGLAQTGTGKTAAYGIPILELVDLSAKIPQALILSPTRELCLQISKDLKNYSKYLKGLSVVAVYGGANIRDQIMDIRKGANVIVATPGRLNDLIRRKAIDLGNINVVVLDEADEMLNLGFQEDIDTILSETPEEKNTWLFSATMPAAVKSISKKYMSNPREIIMGKTKEGAENIRHVYYVVGARDRYLALKRILDFSPELFGIIFCRTKIETQEIAEKLMRDGYNADALHGDLSQPQRDKVMSRFRDRNLVCLVATDVAARGIDVSDVTHVVHFSLPDDMENYTHRSGRTARAGKSGVSLSLVNTKEIGRIRQLERTLNRKFLREMVPTGHEVCEMKLFGLLQKVKDVQVNEEIISEFMPRIMESFSDMSKEELIQRFASLEFNQFLEYYKNAPDINPKMAGDHDGGERYLTGQRMFINLGKMDDMDRSSLLQFICEHAKIERSVVGRIDVKGVYSFYEVEKDKADIILGAFKGVKFNGRPVRVDKASPDPAGGGGGGGDRGRERSRGREASESKGDGAGKKRYGDKDRKKSFAGKKKW